MLPATSPPIPVCPPASAPLEVGAALADITPPAGLATFGHGPEARRSRGYWSRLQCRAFVLQTRGDLPLVIVPCDLAAPSMALQRQVAALVGEAIPAVTAPRIVITATHTHAGPGHYFDAPADTNRFSAFMDPSAPFLRGAFGSSPPGYDPRVTEFLAQRIAGAIERAYRAKAPASIAWGVRESLWGKTQNRNLDPHETNGVDTRYPYAASAPPGLAGELRAVDPRIFVLRMDDLGGAPIGSLAFFAMHPTVLPNDNKVFGGDTHGVVTRALENETRLWQPVASRAAPDGVLHGIVNTNEGDVVPVLKGSGRPARTMGEVERVGLEVAREVWATYATATDAQSEARLDYRYLEVDLPRAPIRGGPERLAAKASLGCGAPGGSSEHRTWMHREHHHKLQFLFESFFEGNRYPNRKDPKKPVAGNLQGFVPLYPTRVPLSLLRLGGKWVAFVPAELTVAAGYEVLSTALTPTGADPRTHGVIAGLANAYIQYVTTASEYDEQRYEGASNLYGRHTAALLGDRLELLARDISGIPVRDELDALAAQSGGRPLPEINEATAIAVDLGEPRRRFDDGPSGGAAVETSSAERGKGVILCRVDAPSERVSPSEVRICFLWDDARPGGTRMVGGRGPWIELRQEDGADLRIRRRPRLSAAPWPAHGAARSVDDTGLDFVTGLPDPRKEAFGARWATVLRLHPDDWRTAPPIGRRVVIRARTWGRDRHIDSPPFDPVEELDAARGGRGLPSCAAEEALKQCSPESWPDESK